MWPQVLALGEVIQALLFVQVENIEIVAQGFGGAQEQHGIGLHDAGKTALDVLAGFQIEINGYVAKENDVVETLFCRVFVGHQVEHEEAHRLADVRVKLKTPGGFGEVFLAQSVAYATKRKRRIQGLAGLVQNVQVHVAGVNRDLLQALFAMGFEDGHGQAVGFFAGRAAGTENAQRTLSSLCLQARQQAVYQQGDLLGFAEKIGFVDGQLADQGVQLGL